MDDFMTQKTNDKTPDAKAAALVGRWLGVSRYDRASSLLLTLLATVALAAVLLFVVWLNGKRVEASHDLSPTLVAIGRESEDGDGRPGGGSQLADPDANDSVVGHDKQTIYAEQDFAALSTLTAWEPDRVDDPDAFADQRKGPFGKGNGRNGPDGPGTGPKKRKDHSVDLQRHWEVTFASNTLDAYARQLDFFRIELGLLQPGNKIVYAFNLTKAKPDTRTDNSPADNERRYYLTWRTGEMQEADHELLTRAGVDPGDRLILKFLPRETEGQLIALERAYNGLTPKDIRKTRFGVIAEGGGFKFVVIDQMVKR
jgi:hypothetical protein